MIASGLEVLSFAFFQFLSFVFSWKMLWKKSAPVLGGTVTVTAETMAGTQRLDVSIISVWSQNPCQNRICKSSNFVLKNSDRKHSWGLLMFGYSAGKSDAKSEEPVDWSFAVLELLREQGWDVKEMNDRYKRVVTEIQT